MHRQTTIAKINQTSALDDNNRSTKIERGITLQTILETVTLRSDLAVSTGNEENAGCAFLFVDIRRRYFRGG